EYPLSVQTIALLTKASLSGLPMSLRDYHTVNVLGFKGFKNLMMTGCPASYDLPSIGQPVQVSPSVNKVAFSLGVSFVSSESMKNSMKDIILKLGRHFHRSAEFEVVFHHSLDPDVFMTAHGSTLSFNRAHLDFSKWLSDQGIRYVDISGSAEALIDYYSSVDLH